MSTETPNDDALDAELDEDIQAEAEALVREMEAEERLEDDDTETETETETETDTTDADTDANIAEMEELVEKMGKKQRRNTKAYRRAAKLLPDHSTTRHPSDPDPEETEKAKTDRRDYGPTDAVSIEDINQLKDN